MSILSVMKRMVFKKFIVGNGELPIWKQFQILYDYCPNIYNHVFSGFCPHHFGGEDKQVNRKHSFKNCHSHECLGCWETAMDKNSDKIYERDDYR
jgi:hypothetical protein